MIKRKYILLEIILKILNPDEKYQSKLICDVIFNNNDSLTYFTTMIIGESIINNAGGLRTRIKYSAKTTEKLFKSFLKIFNYLSNELTIIYNNTSKKI